MQPLWKILGCVQIFKVYYLATGWFYVLGILLVTLVLKIHSICSFRFPHLGPHWRRGMVDSLRPHKPRGLEKLSFRGRVGVLMIVFSLSYINIFKLK